jgi:hypothetical protein
MFDWLFGKKDVKRVEDDTKKGFEGVKKDVTALTGWIKHLNSEMNTQRKELEDIKVFLSSIQEDVEGVKNIVSIITEVKPNKVFKTPKQVFNKQTGVYPVQTGVQTGVQTPNLNQFSVTERAILLILLNTDMKLSYEDLAAMLGKEKSTIRGQINSIKQKSEGFIEELMEKSGKKRVFIPEEMKGKVLKKSKVRVNKAKKEQNLGENE